jgi:hypothetical protein
MIPGFKAVCQDSIPITISVSIFEYFEGDEWIHLKISNFSTSEVRYDSLAIVTKDYGFNDTVYLDSGTYKCEIIDMGANVSMPIITLNDGFIVPWGYPDYEYFLFTLPSYSGISQYDNNELLKICPNPVNDKLKIEISQKSEVEILTIDGQIIQSFTVEETSSIKDISRLSRGVYFIKAKMNKGFVTKKLIKQ